MLTVRLKAADIKMLQDPLLDPVVVRDLIRTRVEEAETLKEMSRGAKAPSSGLSLQEATSVLHSVLGNDLRQPPNPDGIWYQRVIGTLKRHGLDAAYLRKLGEYARANLKPPYGLDFLIGQHMMILGGKYDNQTATRHQATPKARNYIEERLT